MALFEKQLKLYNSCNLLTFPKTPLSPVYHKQNLLYEGIWSFLSCEGSTGCCMLCFMWQGSKQVQELTAESPKNKTKTGADRNVGSIVLLNTAMCQSSTMCTLLYTVAHNRSIQVNRHKTRYPLTANCPGVQPSRSAWQVSRPDLFPLLNWSIFFSFVMTGSG